MLVEQDYEYIVRVTLGPGLGSPDMIIIHRV